MRTHRGRRRSRGFTLVEIMVALIIIVIGLLGIAKMQALSLASTSVSRLRALAAIEAASLASSMHVNRAYWAAATLTQPIAVTGTSATTSDSNLSSALTTVGSDGTDYCVPGAGAPCAPVTMAAADLKGWAIEMNRMLPNSSATITCPTTSIPLTCTIQIKWTENAVAINQQSGATGGEFQLPTYSLEVEP
jgi:type IV pilus assembly protein PilV